MKNLIPDKETVIVTFLILVIGGLISGSHTPKEVSAERRYDKRIELCKKWELTEEQYQICTREALEERLRESL